MSPLPSKWCTKCGINVAVRNQDPAKTTFYVRHEKLGGAPWGRGKHKADRIKRCYIGRQNVQHLKSVREYQMENTLMKSKSKNKGLDGYIEPEIKYIQK